MLTISSRFFIPTEMDTDARKEVWRRPRMKRCFHIARLSETAEIFEIPKSPRFTRWCLPCSLFNVGVGAFMKWWEGLEGDQCLIRLCLSSFKYLSTFTHCCSYFPFWKTRKHLRFETRAPHVSHAFPKYVFLHGTLHKVWHQSPIHCHFWRVVKFAAFPEGEAFWQVAKQQLEDLDVGFEDRWRVERLLQQQVSWISSVENQQWVQSLWKMVGTTKLCGSRKH